MMKKVNKSVLTLEVWSDNQQVATLLNFRNRLSMKNERAAAARLQTNVHRLYSACRIGFKVFED